MGDGFLLWLTAGVVDVILNAFLTSLGGATSPTAPPNRAMHKNSEPTSQRKTPHQTRRYLLTDGGKRVNLLGSMCVWVKDASQRPVTFACGG